MINVRVSERVTVIGAVDPKDGAASAQNTGWKAVKPFSRIAWVIQVGALAGTAVDAKIQQAQDASGTGAKDISGKAIVQHDSTDNRQFIIELNSDELDIANGFDFVQGSITPTGAGVNMVSGVLLGVDPAYLPASDSKASTLVQNVN